MIFTRRGRRFLVDPLGRLQAWVELEPGHDPPGTWVTGSLVDWEARCVCGGPASLAEAFAAAIVENGSRGAAR